MLPTEAEFLAMDGIDFSYWAHRLGIAPEQTMSVWDDGTEAFLGIWYHASNGYPTMAWRPHENLAQADAVLRSMRAMGWDTHVRWFAERGAGQIGVWRRPEGRETPLGSVIIYQAGESEAQAILLACCLAVARWQRAEEETL